MNTTKFLLVISGAVIITACGGSESSSLDSPHQAITMSGKAIDGYIQGATAFLDINANGILDKGEPSDTTDEQGQYDFNLSNEQAECQQYAATVIDVPIGAIDSDYPDNPITEPYQLTYPPSIATTSDSDILAVTPLSTIVWVGIQRDLTAEDKSPTCTALLHNEELRGDIINRVEEQELRVAYRYNITVDELYSDYVETNNEELHLLAQNLVPGLQKSYDETSDISKEGYDYAYVEYFLASPDWPTDAYENSEATTWYRLEFIQSEEGNWEETTWLYSYDLEEQLGLVEYKEAAEQKEEGLIKTNFLAMSRNMFSAPEQGIQKWEPGNENFYCSIANEALQAKDDARGYSVAAFIYNTTSIEDCREQVQNRANELNESVIAKTINNEENTMQESIYRSEQGTVLHPTLFAGKIDSDSLDTLTYYSSDFDTNDLNSAFEVWKSHQDYNTYGDIVQTSKFRSFNKTSLDLNLTSPTKVTEHYADGTNSSYCHVNNVVVDDCEQSYEN